MTEDRTKFLTDNAKAIIVDMRAANERQREELAMLNKRQEAYRQQRDQWKHHVSQLLDWVNYVSISGRYEEMSELEAKSFLWLMKATADTSHASESPQRPSNPADSAPR